MFHSEGHATFQCATQTEIICGTLEIVIQEVVWSIRVSYSAIWSLTPTNVKWHSDPWRTVTSQLIGLSINFMTLIPRLTFTELWVVSMESDMPAGNAYPSGHLVPSPRVRTCLCSNCLDHIPRTRHVFTLLFILNTPLALSRFCLATYRLVGIMLIIKISALKLI